MWEPQPQDLYDSKQQQDIGEEWQWGPSIDSVPNPEAVNLTNNSLYNDNMKAKLYGQKGMLQERQQLPVPLR